MASKQSNVSFVLFTLGMALLMCGLLLVPNQLFGDDPIEAPPPPTQNCTPVCDLDQNDPCCEYSVALGACWSHGRGLKCPLAGGKPCSGPGTATVTCTVCACKRLINGETGAPSNFCECQP